MLVKGYNDFNNGFSFEIDTDDYDLRNRKFTSLIFDDGEYQFMYKFDDLDDLLNQYTAKKMPVFKKFFNDFTIDFDSLEYEYSENENLKIYDDYDFYYNYPTCYELFMEDCWWWTEDLEQCIKWDVEAATELKSLKWYFWVLKSYTYNEDIEQYILPHIAANVNLFNMDIDDLITLYKSNEFSAFAQHYQEANGDFTQEQLDFFEDCYKLNVRKLDLDKRYNV